MTAQTVSGSSGSSGSSTQSAKSVGETLKHLRGARGLSLGGLAERSGVHKATLSRWESGKQRPSIPELEATLSALNAPPETRRVVIGLLGASGAPRALKVLRGEAQSAALPLPLLQNGMPGTGSLLRALRLRRGWSQEQVASQLKRHLSAVSLWERGAAWPKPDVLRDVCALLGATPAEANALLTGRLHANETEEDLDALEYGFRSHLSLLDSMSELYPAMDLAFIALEASLWTHGLRRPSVRPLLGEVYAHHANYLRNAGRFIEGGSCGQKALALMQEAAPQSASAPDWTHLAAVCVADAAAKGGSYPRPERGEAILRQRLSRFRVPVPYTAWILRKISDYQFARDLFTEAAQSLRASGALGKHTSQWGEGLYSVSANTVEIQRYMASQLLTRGLPDEAWQWLPEEEEENPLNRLRDYLLWADANLQASRFSDAHTWIERAYHEIRAHHLTHRFLDFERLAARL